MKHIKNTGRYAISFAITDGNIEKKIVLDKRRIYMDTGNIATTGITSVDDKVYEKLNKIPEFKKLVEKGELSLASDAELTTNVEAKDKEIAELKAKLKKAEDKEVKKELEAKDKEIASLKAQLEAKGKKAEDKEVKKELEAKDKEIASLKAQLEAKGKKENEEADEAGEAGEAEGF